MVIAMWYCGPIIQILWQISTEPESHRTGIPNRRESFSLSPCLPDEIASHTWCTPTTVYCVISVGNLLDCTYERRNHGGEGWGMRENTQPRTRTETERDRANLSTRFFIISFSSFFNVRCSRWCGCSFLWSYSLLFSRLNFRQKLIHRISRTRLRVWFDWAQSVLSWTNKSAEMELASAFALSLHFIFVGHLLHIKVCAIYSRLKCLCV